MKSKQVLLEKGDVLFYCSFAFQDALEKRGQKVPEPLLHGVEAEADRISILFNIYFHPIGGLGPRSGGSLDKECMPAIQRFLGNRLVVRKIAGAVADVKRKRAS